MVAESLLLIAVVFGPLAFGCVEPWSLAILQILLLMMYVSASGLPDAPNPAAKTLLPATLCLAFISLLQFLHPSSVTDPAPLLPWTASSHRTHQALILLLVYAGLLSSAPKILARPGALHRFAWAVLLTGLAVALIGLVQIGFDMKAVYGFRPIRYGRAPFGPFFNSGLAASMMVLSLFMGCGLFLARWARWRREEAYGALRSDFLKSQIMAGLAIAVVFCGIMKAGNRGALASMILSFAAIGYSAARFAQSKKTARLIRLCILLSLMVPVAWLWRHPEWVGVHGDVMENSLSFRILMYQGGWRLLSDSPLFGAGAGSVISAFPPYQDAIMGDVVDHVHNDWLEIPLQWGLFGFAALAIGFLLFSLRVRGAWQNAVSREQRCLAAGPMAAGLAFVIQGLVNFSFQIPANAVIFLAILSWLGAQCSLWERKAAVPERPLSQGVRLALSGLAVGLAIAAALPAAAWACALKASLSPPKAQLQSLSKAYALDPDPIYLDQMARAYERWDGPESPARRSNLRKALEYSARTLRGEPRNRDFLRMQSYLLQALERSDDARRLLL